MPAKQRLRPHGEDDPGGPRQVATQRRQHQTVNWAPAQSICPSAAHTDLLAEHDQLKADGSVTPDLNRDQVDDRAEHGIDD